MRLKASDSLKQPWSRIVGAERRMGTKVSTPESPEQLVQGLIMCRTPPIVAGPVQRYVV
jgi:hypothetical protein